MEAYKSMSYKILTFKETSSGLQKQLEQFLGEGWTIERADVLGKNIIYILYKADK